VRNFVSVVGDVPISRISGNDMLEFRDWWLDRIETEGLTPNSANKDLIHLGKVLKEVNRLKRLGLVLPLTDLSLKEGQAGQRPPFSTEWLQEKILAKGALAGLNAEARCLLLAMVNTGARPSELAALRAPQIRLDEAVPHISIEAVSRQLKSKSAKRIIPLCGVSFVAMQEFPDGFPRYHNSSASLSATINKFLRKNDLLETPHHSLYGLRHSFEDRLLSAEVDERIRRDLMGHALNRVRYGSGANLKHLQKVVQAASL
jgi:integrase